MTNKEQTCQLIVDILNEHKKAELDDIVNDYLYGKISLDDLVRKAIIVSNNHYGIIEYRIEAVRNNYYHPRVSPIVK